MFADGAHAIANRRLRQLQIGNEFIQDDFLANCSDWWLTKIQKNLSILGYDTQILHNKLNELIPKVKFNSFHYNLLKFYQGQKCAPFEQIAAAIETLKVT